MPSAWPTKPPAPSSQLRMSALKLEPGGLVRATGPNGTEDFQAKAVRPCVRRARDAAQRAPDLRQAALRRDEHRRACSSSSISTASARSSGRSSSAASWSPSPRLLTLRHAGIEAAGDHRGERAHHRAPARRVDRAPRLRRAGPDQHAPPAHHRPRPRDRDRDRSRLRAGADGVRWRDPDRAVPAGDGLDRALAISRSIPAPAGLSSTIISAAPITTISRPATCCAGSRPAGQCWREGKAVAEMVIAAAGEPPAGAPARCARDAAGPARLRLSAAHLSRCADRSPAAVQGARHP